MISPPLIDDRTRTNRSRGVRPATPALAPGHQFFRPHTENVAPKRTASTPIAVLTGRTIVPTTSIQTIKPAAATTSP